MSNFTPDLGDLIDDPAEIEQIKARMQYGYAEREADRFDDYGPCDV